jgi:hypothetical protein
MLRRDLSRSQERVRRLESFAVRIVALLRRCGDVLSDDDAIIRPLLNLEEQSSPENSPDYSGRDDNVEGASDVA